MQEILNLDLKIQDTFWLTNCLAEHKVFDTPASKKAVIAYRATDVRDPKRGWSDFNKQQTSLRSKDTL